MFILLNYPKKRTLKDTHPTIFIFHGGLTRQSELDVGP